VAAGSFQQTDRIFRFGPFELAEREGELRKNGVRIKLQEQPFRVLVELVANAGRVVSREDLQQKLWLADTFVDFDVGLNTAIRKLRQALGDDAERIEKGRFTTGRQRHWENLQSPTIAKIRQLRATCPVKRCLAEKPEEWKWSSFRTYACGEEGLVKVNCQEWPLRITCSALRSHSFETRE
jgi:hypothetical protein